MSKNTHMEHIEDLIINEGYVGGVKAIRHLLDLRDGVENVTIKWDGAPAIFFGIDPEDRQFFVSTKGVFNKTPKLYKSVSEITGDAKVSSDLAAKLSQAYIWLKKLNINEGVYQGDLMWTADDVDATGNVHPNTIVYDIEESLTHKFGIVVHTKYQGERLDLMTAKFIKKIPDWMSNVPGLWIRGAGYDGNPSFVLNGRISQLWELLDKINPAYLDGLAASDLAQERLKCFINTFVRSGDRKIKWNQFRAWNNAYYAGEEAKRKTENGKASVEAKRKEVDHTVIDFFDHDYNLLSEFYILMAEAKSELVQKLNVCYRGPACYFRDKSGWLHGTNPEGYVSIAKHSAVKLIDRYEFSKANFSTDLMKGWEK